MLTLLSERINKELVLLRCCPTPTLDTRSLTNSGQEGGLRGGGRGAGHVTSSSSLAAEYFFTVWNKYTPQMSLWFWLRFSVVTLKIHYRFTADSLQIHYRFTADSLQINCRFTTDSQQIHYRFTTDSLQI